MEGAKQFPGYVSCCQEKYTPVFLLSASNVEGSACRGGWTYIQGAGDDHQSWSLGLTPRMFWQHKDWILEDGIDPETCEQTVLSIVSEKPPASRNGQLTSADVLLNAASIGVLRIGCTGVHIASLSMTGIPAHFAVLNCTSCVYAAADAHVSFLWIPVAASQKHSLEQVLPRMLHFINTHLRRREGVCVICDSGTNVSVAVCVAALALLFDATYTYTYTSEDVSHEAAMRGNLDKSVIRRVQMYISSFVFGAYVDRNLIKQVNRFFLCDTRYIKGVV
jgi:tRNA A64-2'-O-ribosylphosphate transferase